MKQLIIEIMPAKLLDAFKNAARCNEHIVVEWEGRPLAAIVSLRDLRVLEGMVIEPGKAANVEEANNQFAEGATVIRDELPQELLFTHSRTKPEATPAPTEDASLIERTDQLESELIRDALERFHWNKTKAAELLGLKRTTLQYKIRKYGLE